MLADDDPQWRATAAALLRHAGYEVECAEDAADAARRINGAEAVVIVDVNMPGNRDLELVRAVAESGGGPPIMIVTGWPSLPNAVDALRLSVADYLIKPVRAEELLERVKTVVESSEWERSLTEARSYLKDLEASVDAIRAAIGDGQAPPLARPRDSGSLEDRLSSLSRREREVVEELTLGKGTTEIAATLFISPNTVRNHFKAIYRKLGVNSRSQLLQELLRSRKG